MNIRFIGHGEVEEDRLSLVPLRMLLALVGIAGTGMLLYLLLPGEPKYQGKPLSFWIGQLEIGRYDDEKTKQEATTALRSMADAAVPYLIKVLERNDSHLTKVMN